MTRKEQIEQAAKAFDIQIISNPWTLFERGAEWADAHPNWISVGDELPPKKNEYDGLSINVLATDGKEVYESVYYHDSKDWFTHDMWELDNITHWMLPPLPPKKGD